MAATDKEGDEAPLDLEGRRIQGAGRVIAAAERVDQPLSEKTLDLHLPGPCAVGRGASKRLAGGLPRAVVGAFEIGDQQVIGCAGTQRGRECYDKESSLEKGFHGTGII